MYIQGTQRGGIPKNTGSFKMITPTTPCSEKNGYVENEEYINSYVLTITWDETFNNGLVSVTYDEFFTNTSQTWNRSLAVGTAAPSKISINQINDGIYGELTFACNKFYLSRQATAPNTPLELFSSDGKQITQTEAENIVPCSK